MHVEKTEQTRQEQSLSQDRVSFDQLRAEFKRKLEAIIQQLIDLRQHNRAAVINFGGDIKVAVEQMQVAAAALSPTASSNEVFALLANLQRLIDTQSSRLQHSSKEIALELIKEYFTTQFQILYLEAYKPFLANLFFAINRLNWNEKVSFQGLSEQTLELITRVITQGMQVVVSPQPQLLSKLLSTKLFHDAKLIAPPIRELLSFEINQFDLLFPQLDRAGIVSQAELEEAVRAIPSTTIEAVAAVVAQESFKQIKTTLPEILASGRLAVVSSIVLDGQISVRTPSTEGNISAADKITFTVTDSRYTQLFKLFSPGKKLANYLIYRAGVDENQHVFAVHNIVLNSYQTHLGSISAFDHVPSMPEMLEYVKDHQPDFAEFVYQYFSSRHGTPVPSTATTTY